MIKASNSHQSSTRASGPTERAAFLTTKARDEMKDGCVLSSVWLLAFGFLFGSGRPAAALLLPLAEKHCPS